MPDFVVDCVVISSSRHEPFDFALSAVSNASAD